MPTLREGLSNNPAREALETLTTFSEQVTHYSSMIALSLEACSEDQTHYAVLLRDLSLNRLSVEELINQCLSVLEAEYFLENQVKEFNRLKEENRRNSSKDSGDSHFDFRLENFAIYIDNTKQFLKEEKSVIMLQIKSDAQFLQDSFFKLFHQLTSKPKSN